jgi:hypothetical protein
MWGHDIVEPRSMLSQVSIGSPALKYDSSALRRSSSSFDHAAAQAAMPRTAVEIMWMVVVLPPPRCPAVMKKAGRSGRSARSMTVSAEATIMHLPA